MVRPEARGAPIPVPPEVARLLDAATPAARDAAWAGFVARYSRLILHTARQSCHDPDQAMDAYAFVLERLGAPDAARLRAYRDDGRTRFTTWLVVVVRRLVLDQHRARYGRVRSADGAAQVDGRRRLQDLVGEALEVDGLPGDGGDATDDLERREVREALDGALAGLPPADRLLLALRFEESLPASRIAPMVGLPTPFHVYRRLQAVCRTLRAELERRGIAGPG